MHYEKFPDGTVKCIEDEIPFELPEGWEWTRIGTLFITVTGSTPSTKDTSLYGDEFPFYKPTDLDKGINVISSIDYVSEKGYNSGRVLPEKSVLVTCIGATIGKIGMIHKTGICNQQINAIIPNIFVLPEYTFFLLNSLYMQEQILTNSSATTLPILNKSKFDNLLIPLTPLDEQKRIVSKLTDLLSFIDTIESDKTDLQTTIQLTKSKILDLAIRGKLVPQDPNDEPASVLLERIRAEKEELIKQGKIKRDKKESVIFRGDDNSYYLKIGNVTETLDDWRIDDIPENWGVCCLGEVCDYGNCTNVDTKDIGSGLQKVDFYYRKSGATNYITTTVNYQSANATSKGPTDKKTASAVITNLKSGTYEYYAVIYDVAGNSIREPSSGTSSVVTKTVDKATGATVTPAYLTNLKATADANGLADPNRYTSVTVSLPSKPEFTTQYQIGTISGTWTDGRSLTRTENAIVYYRYTDGINNGEYSSIDVKNIDKTKPTITTELNGNSGTNKMTLNIGVKDEESGIAKIEWHYTGTIDTTETCWYCGGSGSYEVSGLVPCSYCGGSGYHDGVCTMCGGRSTGDDDYCPRM